MNVILPFLGGENWERIGGLSDKHSVWFHNTLPFLWPIRGGVAERGTFVH